PDRVRECVRHRQDLECRGRAPELDGTGSIVHSPRRCELSRQSLPVFDDGSRRFAEEFYREVCAGKTVGEAVVAARADASARGDVTWAAFALFGGPRVRLRPGRIV